MPDFERSSLLYFLLTSSNKYDIIYTHKYTHDPFQPSEWHFDILIAQFSFKKRRKIE